MKKPPAFWYKSPPPWPTKGLIPFSYAYLFAQHLKKRFTKAKAFPLPSIGIGNVVMGGAGKTPVVEALALFLINRGYKPHILTRGYGGALSSSTPVQVIPSHTPKDVGEEPFLLSKIAPVWVCKDRYAASLCAKKQGADILLSDDGLQNPAYAFDIRLLVVDEHQQFGNGCLFPQGPLRAPLDTLALYDGYICSKPLKACAFLPYISMDKVFKEPPSLTHKNVLAFAGIGYPEKFKKSLEHLGYHVEEFYPFPDHHFYKEKEIKALMEKAARKNLYVFTTAKDFIKISSLHKENIYVLGLSFAINTASMLWLLKSKFSKKF
jgi:tetraacyldisaccharide 4'-kinase